MTANTETTVRQIVMENPHATQVFEAFHIDYCCGGDKPLGEACKKAGVDAEIVLGLLHQSSGQEAGSAPAGAAGNEPWSQAPLSELTRYIVERHHSFVRAETPRLERMLEKVGNRHGAVHPELIEIAEIFGALSEELSAHMLKEERILFPYIEALDGGTRPQACFGSVMGPISVMVAEHEAAGRLLARMRELSSGFAPPEDSCTAYRALYQGLEEFERDLHQHIHLENNILFPRAEKIAN